jgi:pimeloyl-ACP methyl ester carboxylesterase
MQYPFTVSDLIKNSTTVLLKSLFSIINMQSLQLFVARSAMQVTSIVAPRLALRQALERFVTPPRFNFSAQEKKLIDAAERINIAFQHGGKEGTEFANQVANLAVWRIGEANNPVVILCHGWGGRGAQLRAFVPPLVAAGYQVVIFDHLAHGMSDGRKAALVDFWRGVEVVWDAMLDRGYKVDGMVAHSLGGAAVGSALRRNLGRAHRNAPMPRVVLIAPPASLIRYSKLFARYFGISERIRRAMQWRFEQRYGVAWEEFELPNSVATINAPALFIHDHDDRETRLSGSIQLAQTWPDARLHQTHGLGHRRILRDHKVIQHTLDFIANRVEFPHPPSINDDNPAPLY